LDAKKSVIALKKIITNRCWQTDGQLFLNLFLCMKLLKYGLVHGLACAHNYKKKIQWDLIPSCFWFCWWTSICVHGRMQIAVISRHPLATHPVFFFLMGHGRGHGSPTWFIFVNLGALERPDSQGLHFCISLHYQRQQGTPKISKMPFSTQQTAAPHFRIEVF